MPPPIIIVHVLLYLLSLICMFFIIIIVSIISHFIFCVFLYIHFLRVWSSETDHNRILRSSIFSAILSTSNFYPSLFSIITVIISMTNIIIENHLNHIINKNYYQLSAAHSRLKGQLNIAVLLWIIFDHHHHFPVPWSLFDELSNPAYSSIIILPNCRQKKYQ